MTSRRTAAPATSSRIRAEGTISFAGVPLVLGDRILGALGLALSKRHRFAPEEVGLLQTLAGHAAVAIENARLFEAAQEQARELTALDEVRTALTSTLELTAVLESIGEWAIKLIGADGSAVFELDARTQVLNPRTSRDLAPTEASSSTCPSRSDRGRREWRRSAARRCGAPTSRPIRCRATTTRPLTTVDCWRRWWRTTRIAPCSPFRS